MRSRTSFGTSRRRAARTVAALTLAAVATASFGAEERGALTAGVPDSARVVLLPSSPAPVAPASAPASAAAALRVAMEGTGPAVVLLPGLFGSTFGYRKLMPLLATAGYRAIAIEPLGIGGSAKPEQADYSLTAQADRIAAVLPTLGVERAMVVAHASGASIALRMAYRHPERVAAVVSLEGGAAETAATSGFRRALMFAPLLRLFGGLRLIRGKVRSTLERGAADPAWVTDEVVDGYMAAASRDLGGTLAAYNKMANAREPEALGPRLGEIRCPVHLLVGAVPHHGGVKEPEVQALKQRLPSLTIERVPGAGHFIFEEKPDAVVAAVRRTAATARAAADD